MGYPATVTAVPQHLRALERANEVRIARAELKRQIAASEVTVEEVVRDRPWEAERMSLSELLISQKRWGRARCRRLLQPLGLLENKEVGSLTDRQRGALADQLR